MATGPAIVTSLFTSFASAVVVSYVGSMSGFVPSWFIAVFIMLIIPALAYILSILTSVLIRYRSKCKTIDVQGIAVSNLLIVASTFLTGVVLAFENVPILKYIFGEYEPISRYTGMPIERDSKEYNDYLAGGTHYKLQTFSNIVKDVIPYSLKDVITEDAKGGIVYMYYMFFMTLLPSFFVYTTQAACA